MTVKYLAGWKDEWTGAEGEEKLAFVARRSGNDGPEDEVGLTLDQMIEGLQTLKATLIARGASEIAAGAWTMNIEGEVPIEFQALEEVYIDERRDTITIIPYRATLQGTPSATAGELATALYNLRSRAKVLVALTRRGTGTKFDFDAIQMATSDLWKAIEESEGDIEQK